MRYVRRGRENSRSLPIQRSLGLANTGILHEHLPGCKFGWRALAPGRVTWHGTDVGITVRGNFVETWIKWHVWNLRADEPQDGWLINDSSWIIGSSINHHCMLRSARARLPWKRGTSSACIKKIGFGEVQTGKSVEMRRLEVSNCISMEFWWIFGGVFSWFEAVERCFLAGNEMRWNKISHTSWAGVFTKPDRCLVQWTLKFARK